MLLCYCSFSYTLCTASMGRVSYRLPFCWNCRLPVQSSRLEIC